LATKPHRPNPSLAARMIGRMKENRDLYLDLVLLFFETHLFGREDVS
jgi:hypothetical protein